MAADPFPNYTLLRRRVPIEAWHAVRVITVGGAIALAVILVLDEAAGLEVFWRLIIPLLPLVFLVAPGVWRNACPLAATNQVPRLLGFSRGRTAPAWFREYAPVVGGTAFIVIVGSRRAVLDESGPATAALIVVALVGAFVGGVAFKGKSGWCSTICPLLQVQRVYGQTPFVTSPNAHCQPCVGCTQHCYDFNPRVAYLADLYEDDRHHTGYRKLFVGAFPGVVVAYFTIPGDVSAGAVYWQFAVWVGASIGTFFVGEVMLKVSLNKLTSLYGAAAFVLFYWWASSVLVSTLFGDAPAVVWSLRALALGLALAWLLRTWRKEQVFVARATAPTPVRLESPAIPAHQAQQASAPEVVFEPDGVRMVAEPGATLLELAERLGQPIEAGCRLGVCGADPVCVIAGQENLSPAGADERATIERLGLAPSTRMACCARVAGPVSLSLAPEQAQNPVRTSHPTVAHDSSIQRVVIIGNGIAGVTTADHVRRRHPSCRIDVVADEAFPLYNRMGLSRIIYGRSAMIGLQLLPDAWYETNDVTCWLNTRAVAIDRERHEVELALGDRLAYDRLVLAMGGSSHVPRIDGYGAPGTFALRDAGDAVGIRGFAQEHRARCAVVAGGGLLGLEAAHALHKLGLDVTVVERSQRLLRRQLDERASEILRSYLEGRGLHVVAGAQVAWAQSNGRLREVRLDDARSLPADLLVVAAGIAPRVELAAAAGLHVARGVVVDDQMRTSDPSIFAVGDVAEHGGVVRGLWPTAVEQATIAAENVVGGARRYRGTVPVMMLKGVGIDLTSMGRIEPQSENEVEVTIDEPDEHRYGKLVIADGRIVGALLLGRPREASLVSDAIKDGRDVTAHIEALRNGDWRTVFARMNGEITPRRRTYAAPRDVLSHRSG